MTGPVATNKTFFFNDWKLKKREELIQTIDKVKERKQASLFLTFSVPEYLNSLSVSESCASVSDICDQCLMLHFSWICTSICAKRAGMLSCVEDTTVLLALKPHVQQ